MSTKTVIKLTSDNFNNEYLTLEAYREVRLTMSSGDFGSHEYAVVEVDEEIPVITAFCHLTGLPVFDDELLSVDEDEDELEAI
jgi:hypothetical protein